MVRSFHLAIVIALITGVTALSGKPSHAAQTEWQDLGGGKARLLAEYDPVTHRLAGGLEVRLQKGWSTYWRYPGSSGIPPVFDFESTLLVDDGDPKFPVPQLLGEGTNRYAGYKDSVIFPFAGKFNAGADNVLSMNLLIGICETICIPAKASFTIQGMKLWQPDPEVKRLLAQAKATLPRQIVGNGPLIERKTDGNGKLHLVMDAVPGFKRPELLVEGPADWFLTPAKLKDSDPGEFVFLLDVSRAPNGTDFGESKLNFTLVEGNHGIEFQD